MTSLSYTEAFRTWKAAPIKSFPQPRFIRYGGLLLLILFAPADFITTIFTASVAGAQYEVNPLVRTLLENQQYGLFALLKIVGAIAIWIMFTMQNLTLETRDEELLFYIFIIGTNTVYLLVIASNLYVASVFL